jgi:hypothetical protein
LVSGDDSSIVKWLQVAEDMTHNMSHVHPLETPPMSIPDVTKPGGVILAILDHTVTSLGEVVRKMEDSMAEERASIGGGGSTRQHSLDKLCEAQSEAMDSNLGLELARDMARAICIRAQRPAEQMKEDVKDFISSQLDIIAQLTASRSIREGDDGYEIEEDDEDDEDSGGDAEDDENE